MNTIYRIVFNAATNKWVVASELAKGRKRKASTVASLAAAIAFGLGFGGTTAMAQTTPAPGSSCTTSTGDAGTVDASGVCTADSAATTSVQSLSIMTNGGEFDPASPGIAISTDNSATTNTANGIAIGNSAQSQQTTPSGSGEGVAVGWSSNAAGDFSTALGSLAIAGARDSTGAATASAATAVGVNAQALGDRSTAMGASAHADGSYSTALGVLSSVSADSANGVALGRSASVSNAADSIAIGTSSSATAANAVALGASSVANVANTVSVGNSTSQRRIVNMAAGVAPTDAVNVSQLQPMVDALGGGASIDPTTGAVTGPTYNLANGGTQTTVGGALSALDGALTTANTNIDANTTDINNLQSQLDSGSIGLVQQDPTSGNITVGAATGGTSVDFTGTNGPRVLSGVANGTADSDAATVAQLKAMGLYDPNTNLPLAAVVYDGIDLSSVTFGGANGTLLNNVAPGLIASGSMQAVNGGQLFDMQQNFQSQFNLLNNQYANLDGRVSTIEQSIADGSIGGPGDGGGTPDLSGSGQNSTQAGSGANASGDNSTAVGSNAVASGSNSTATGAGSTASGSGSTANGANATASGTNSTALGSNSSATGSNSVALGAGSVADRDNSVSVGSAGNERQITNVAAGTARTDAANWGQVQDAVNGVQNWADQKFTQLDKRINGMGAMSAAYGQMAFSAQGIEKRSRIGVGVGMQNGQSAIAVGYMRQIKPNLNVSFGGSASANDVSVGAGMAFGWD